MTTSTLSNGHSAFHSRSNINGDHGPTSASTSAFKSTPNGSLNGNRSKLTSSSHAMNGSKSDSGSSPVSYEQFAPKSSDIRNRLTKLQGMTAGPISIASTPASTKTNPTMTSSKTQVASPFLQAMVPSIEQQQQQQQQQKSSKSQSSKAAITNPQILKTIKQTQETSTHIAKILTNTTSLHSTLLQTTNLVSAITNRHSTLLQHSSELSHAAERLQNESDQLAQHAEEIGLPLKHYDAVDRLGLQVGVLFKNGVMVNGIAKVKVDDDDFVNVLQDVDDAVGFFYERSEISLAAAKAVADQDGAMNGMDNPNNVEEGSAASGSVEYYKRSLTLQESCMDLFKEAITNRIKQTTMQVTNALDLHRKSVSGDTLEASLIYTRFHGISSRSRHLLSTVKKRMGNSVVVPSERGRRISSTRAGRRASDMICPYTELWNTCRNTYIECRTGLLHLSVRNHLDFLKDKHGLIGMTRLASVFLMRLCTAETAMYLDFFGHNEQSESNDDNHDTAAQNGVQNGSGPSRTSNDNKKKKDAATLASQVMAKDGTYYDSEFQGFLDALCNNLHRTIRRGLVSILDLDTLCQIVSVLREERSLANASPTTMAAARSLGRVIVDAQERLIFCANDVLSKEVARFKATPADLDYPDNLRRCREQQDEKKEGGDAFKLQMQIYESWFPPIRSVLKVLSKIFRVVEPKVFEDIALSSVQHCSKSLKEGSSYIEKKSGILHSDLFLVKHLLILREQLSPFDIQLRSVERQLDFSDAGKAVSRFLANRNRRLFSMTTENALVTLLREGVHTREASIDSKRDLEDALRSACNDFIEHTAMSLAGPVMTFVEQCKSITSVDATLSSQSFMTGDYVSAVVTRTLDRLEPELGEVHTQMGLYMENKATQSILLKPVIKKIVRVLEDTKNFISQCAVEDNDAWKEGMKDEVYKCIRDIEILIKTAYPGR